MKKILTISFLILSLYYSCDDSDNIIYKTYLYEETQCFDSWNTGLGDTDTEVATAVENYLMNLNVILSDIQVDSLNEGESCDACFCKSGRGIFVTTDENNESILLNENFVTQ